ncbi:MAG TPA: 6-pyruvoyl-tetrahydropterin synthase-related protein [Patescibacteria group bacterium]|nr:6-pyruvoyl-tetrahydropterin synthase-related protein [Patescibacteria group bacterium]
MKLLQKITKSTNFWPILAVLFFAILAGRTLIFEKGYFNMHDDLQMMRQLEMEKCFADGQVPCRWVPDMGYGYGFPLFNFYPPLPYFVGTVFRVLHFNFTDTVKLTFALSFVISGLTMYFLAKEFFGKWGGVISSIFYIWAPYHSVDIYVRGAMNEAWALVWFPLILWVAYKLIQSDKKETTKWLIGLGLSWTGLLLSHNLMVMIFTPVFALWCLMFWVKKHDWKKFFQLICSGILAASLAAFFTLPAIFEQKFVHVDTLTQGYYEYIAHFATIGQLLFSRFWGFGPSIWGPNDGMPFQVGHVHWILSLVILIFATLVFVNRRKYKIDPNILYTIYFSIAFGWFATFMAHQDSTFIWQKIHFLAFVQFPWRFLTLAILGFSLAAGSVMIIFPRKVAVVIGLVLITLLVILNWNYFLPLGGKMGPLSEAQKFSGAAWDLQRTAGIFDYLPVTAKQNPKDPSVVLAEIFTGNGNVTNTLEGTNWARFDVNLTTDSVVRIDLFQFPNWKITLDGNSIEPYIPETELYGRMYTNIPKGNHSVSLKLANTPIRAISNYLSILAWAGLLSYPFWKKRFSNGKLD